MDAVQRLLEQANQSLGRLDGLASVLPNLSLFICAYIRKKAVLFRRSIAASFRTCSSDFAYNRMMQATRWTTSHAVFVTEIDDEHKQLFDALGGVQRAVAAGARLNDVQHATQRVLAGAKAHFAHEERLMRASRYRSIAWHKLQHDHARKRVGQYFARIEKGDTEAAGELTLYLTGWLHDHTRLADRMLGAHLRNMNLCRLTIRGSSEPSTTRGAA